MNTKKKFRKEFVETFLTKRTPMNKQEKNPYTGIVKYKYQTGTKEMERRYGIKPHYHGPFECDIEDFKKFFGEVTKINPLGSGEVEAIWLAVMTGPKKGAYSWYQGKGWTYLGR